MSHKTLLKSRFASSFKQYDALAVVQEEICASLAEMVQRLGPMSVQRALEVGAGTGFLTRHLLRLYPRARWTINDLAQESEAFVRTYLQAGMQVDYLWGDAEAVELPQALDLVASASAVQWFDDLPQFLSRVRERLSEGGYVAFTTFGPENFREIEAATGDGLTYYTLSQLRELLLSEGFTLMESLEQTKQLHFDTPTDVLRHIKATGVNSIRQTRWTKKDLTAFEERYRASFTTSGGRVTLTYHPIWIVARS